MMTHRFNYPISFKQLCSNPIQSVPQGTTHTQHKNKIYLKYIPKYIYMCRYIYVCILYICIYACIYIYVCITKQFNITCNKNISCEIEA